MGDRYSYGARARGGWPRPWAAKYPAVIRAAELSEDFRRRALDAEGEQRRRLAEEALRRFGEGA